MPRLRTRFVPLVMAAVWVPQAVKLCCLPSSSVRGVALHTLVLLVMGVAALEGTPTVVAHTVMTGTRLRRMPNCLSPCAVCTSFTPAQPARGTLQKGVQGVAPDSWHVPGAQQPTWQAHSCSQPA